MLKGYKTIIFNAIMTIIMVMNLWGQGGDLPDAESVSSALDAVDAALAAVWGIGNAILRAITDTPIFKSKDEG